MKTNVLYYGDNLGILRHYIPNESVDLVYLDPPFNSNRDYNVIFKDESGRKSDGQLLALRPVARDRDRDLVGRDPGAARARHPVRRAAFESAILPKRRYLSLSTQRLFARLYLEGLSSGDFEPAFRELLAIPETTRKAAATMDGLLRVATG